MGLPLSLQAPSPHLVDLFNPDFSGLSKVVVKIVEN